MAIEMTAAALTKTLTPTITALAKEFGAALKNQKLKWDATSSIKKLTQIILNINTVKTMWSRDKGVLIKDFYHPPRIIQKNQSAIQKTTTDIISGNSVIEGIVGQGKSILMRNLCNEIIDRGSIPIFIELRMISSERALMDLILDYMDAAGIRGGKEIFDFLATDGKVSLVLDGFDETPENMVTSTIYAIQNIQKTHIELPIIISSRPHQSVQRLASFTIFEIDEFNEDDYQPFLKKLIKDIILRENIYQSLTDAPNNIRGVITTPLMLTLLCLVYEMESHIPATLPDFFNSLFSAVFTRHDRFKPGFQRERYSGLGESKLHRLFDAFCFMVIQLDFGRTMKNINFNRAFEEALEYAGGISCDIEGFRKDIVNVACLMLEDGYDQISFLHKSILEYHAASFIKNSSSEIATDFYEAVAQELHSWEEVLSFLRYVDEFRYGKHYILRYYPVELEQISNTIRSQDEKAYLLYLEEKLPDFLMEISGSKITSFSVKNPPIVLPFHYLLTDLMHDIADAAIENASDRSIFNAIRATKSSQTGFLEISLKAMFKHLNPKGIASALIRVEEQIKTELIKSESVVGAERKKLKIFRS
ncbi:NTPase (NACHT family)-like protein [Pseudomonas chlororaphis]|uniref:NACHT domain-containing protein n=1 Tax=Pseudomonas chlororaphis TaxID=587753 RepID=UPI000F58599A|nr:NACHT domain-containing protein [Pseudomonas chlororaphis]AZD10309.1 NTPase (NACHT family)-like protein [Pseudomonas chlororaphis]